MPRCLFIRLMRRVHITVRLHHRPVHQRISDHAICVIVKVLQSAHIRNYNTLMLNVDSVQPTLEMWWISEKDALYCTPLEGSPVFWTPLLSLEVIIVSVCEVAFRERIHRFTLFLPALCSHLCRVLIPREGQVSSDAVPDSVAHHAVTAALRADQLSPVKGGDENENTSGRRNFLPRLWKNDENDTYRLLHNFLQIHPLHTCLNSYI